MSVREPSPELARRLAEGSLSPEAIAWASNQPAIDDGTKVRGKTKADSARAASKRAKTGAKFEAQLDDTHEGFIRDGFGVVLPHYPPTVKIPQHSGPPKLIYRTGGGPCDYSGHVNMITADRSVDWKLAKFFIEYRPLNGWQVPVVFDAKVLGEKHLSYRHDPKRIAQVKHLENAQRGGALAFLLIRADDVGRVFCVSYRNHADELLRSKPITLFERTGRECFPLLPSIGYTPGKGWLWPAMLPYIV